MKGKMVVIIFLAFTLMNGRLAFAAGQNGMNMDHSQKKHDMSNMDMSGKDKNMDKSGSKKENTMAGMDMGGNEPVKETPPSLKVLGTYGAVNLSFILIGVWSKWFRRKDGSNGYSK